MNISGASGLASLFSGNGRKLSLDVGELFKEVFEDEQIAQEEAVAAAETENEANFDLSDDEAVLEAGFREAIYNWKSRFAELYEEEEEEANANEVESNIGLQVDEAGVTIPEAPSDEIVAGASSANNQFAGLNENGTEKTGAEKTVRKTAGLFADEEEEKTALTSSLFGNQELDDEFLNLIDEMQLSAAADMQQTLRSHPGKGASLQDSGMILNDLGMRYPNTQAWLASREMAYADE